MAACKGSAEPFKNHPRTDVAMSDISQKPDSVKQTNELLATKKVTKWVLESGTTMQNICNYTSHLLLKLQVKYLIIEANMS